MVTEVICLSFQDNNLYYINIYNIIDMILVGWFYIFLFKNKVLKLITIALLISILFFSIFNITIIQGFYNINSYFLVSKAFIIIMLSVSLLIELLSNLDIDKSIIGKPEFWVASGFLIYYGGNFFVFAYSYEIFVFNAEFHFNVWHIHSILNIILSFQLAIAILVNQKNRWIRV